MAETSPDVALFATCLVDAFRPSVGFAAAKLVEESGSRVVVPEAQTCCGQPAYNSGDRATATKIAKQVVDTFAPFAAVVVPSGSCAGMIKQHYPALLADDPAYAAKAKALAAKTHELLAYLVDVRKMTRCAARCSRTATYHDSCSGLRELGVKAQPRTLLKSVDGLALIEAPNAETCCGFGGTFCVKYPEVSTRIVDAKITDAIATGADLVLGGDLGCLMTIAGRLSRQGSTVEVRHVAEVLAGLDDRPAIGVAKTPPQG
ncbi:MAG: (Fe-S)-binding protein [Rhodospirillales bacterium]|nr:(Fe-S)-binding protein [Rhodospirillales bacterium]